MSRLSCHRQQLVPSFFTLSAALVVCLSLLSLTACNSNSSTRSVNTSSSGSNSTVPTAVSPAGGATVQQVSASDSAGAGESGPVEATVACPEGTTMLSGGYGLSGGDNAAITQILASHPDTQSSWTATAQNAAVGGPYTLTVYAYCLHAHFSLTTQVINTPVSTPPDSNFHEGSAACPSGSEVTGGGFSSEIGSIVSAPIIGVGTSPDARAWDAEIGMTQDHPIGAVFPETPVVYAVCVSSPLMTESAPATQQAITTASGNLNVSCPSGQLLVGGGFALDHAGANAYGSTLAGNGKQWTVSASFLPFAGASPAINQTAYAVCVALLATT
jgi:hypothetical protein